MEEKTLDYVWRMYQFVFLKLNNKDNFSQHNNHQLRINNKESNQIIETEIHVELYIIFIIKDICGDWNCVY